MLLLLGLLAVSCRKSDTPDAGQVQSRTPGEPAAAMDGMRASEFRGGEKRWELAAGRAVYDKSVERTVLTEVTMIVQGKRPLGAVTLTSRQADYMNVHKDLVLPVGVQATGDRRLRFSANQARFSNASSLLLARGQIRYEDELVRVEGDEMVFDAETRNLKLSRNVRATIQPQGLPQ